MPRYTLRHTFPDRANDNVFRADGQDAGRCYLSDYPDGPRWHWTVYGSPAAGLELTLNDAKAKFKGSFEQLNKERPAGSPRFQYQRGPQPGAALRGELMLRWTYEGSFPVHRSPRPRAGEPDQGLFLILGFGIVRPVDRLLRILTELFGLCHDILPLRAFKTPQPSEAGPIRNSSLSRIAHYERLSPESDFKMKIRTPTDFNFRTLGVELGHYRRTLTTDCGPVAFYWAANGPGRTTVYLEAASGTYFRL